VFKISQAMEIERPAEVVWPYLAALEQVPLWEHGIIDVKQIDQGPLRVGLRFTAGRIYAGKATHLAGHVRVVEEGHSMTAALRGGPHVESFVTYSVDSVGADRCRVTYIATGQMRFPLNLLDPIFPLIGRAETRKNLVRLRRRILAGIPATSNLRTPD
jgi:carbon monoxide dehydrogenase subunit G